MRIPLESYNNIRNSEGYLVIPQEWNCKDGKFKQIRRENNVVIYQRDFHYEVCVVQSQNPFEITKGVFTEKKENLPSDSLWGTVGFTCLTLESAEKRFNELLNKQNDIPPAQINSDGQPVKRKRGRPAKKRLTVSHKYSILELYVIPRPKNW